MVARKKPTAALPPAVPQAMTIAQQIALNEQKIKITRRLIAAKKSRDDLIEFTKFTMPDPEDLDDPQLSRYKPARHHEILAAALQEVEAGRILRLAVSMFPQSGKSEICSRRFSAWYIGRNPEKNLMFGTYSQDFSEKFGYQVRGIIDKPNYRQVFPKVTLADGSKSRAQMTVNEYGGSLLFLGRGGMGSGNPASIFLIDDPIKDAKEAQSATIRDDVWDWYTHVVEARCNVFSAQIIVQCMTGDTLVMLPDGSERRLDAIRAGNKVATYEDGRLGASTVTAWKSNGRDLVYKITMSSGRIVRANGRHPFLVSDNGELKWVRTRSLNIASRIVAVQSSGVSGRGRSASSKSAGSLSGAGATACLITSRKSGLMGIVHRLTIRCLSALAISRAATALPATNTLAYFLSRAANVLSAASLRLSLHLTGRMGFALTTATEPASSAGFSAMDATFQSGQLELSASRSLCLHTSDFTADRVLSVEPDGEEEVFDVQIDRTENFIANGLVSHNTRWSEDDLIGRLTDPNNPHYHPLVAKQWKVINIPAVITDDELALIMGKNVGDALWPERFPLETLAVKQALDPVAYSALYMGKPTPPEGVFFKKEEIFTYDPEQTPKNFRPYMTGDLALGDKKANDHSCVGKWMLDERDNLYLSPDLYWDRKKADASVEKILDMMKDFEPMDTWWEKGQIDKAVGPFLMKRAAERKIYHGITALPVAGDKGFRASAIRGRMRMGKVFFPRFAPWWPRAKEELLKFTGSGDDMADDFVDMCSLIGQALGKQIRAESTGPSNVVALPQVGTLGWVKHAARMEARDEERRKKRAGF